MCRLSAVWGAGNKLDASQFRVADIYKTKVCPLAKVMRRELKKRGVKKLKVVYSEEQPTRPVEDMAISCRTNCICPPEQLINVRSGVIFQAVWHLCHLSPD